MNAIHIENISKKYGELLAVDKVSLNIEEGELFALLGVNGAGKTTLIKMLSCIAAPTDGDAVLLGHSIKTDSAAVKRHINISPQETAVAANLSVAENLSLIAGLYGQNVKTAQKNTQIGRASCRERV